MRCVDSLAPVRGIVTLACWQRKATANGCLPSRAGSFPALGDSWLVALAPAVTTKVKKLKIGILICTYVLDSKNMLRPIGPH